MSLIWFLIFGLIVGFIARAIMPGRQSMGVGTTAVLGCAGSVIGGLVGNLIAGTPATGPGGRWQQLSTAGFVGSILGAIALMVILGAVQRARHRGVHHP